MTVSNELAELGELAACFEPGVLSLTRATALLEQLKIPMAKWVLVDEPDKLAEAGREIGFPLVMKVESSDITHKTDVGGVWAGIRGSQELESAHAAMLEMVRKNQPSARIVGVTLHEQLTGTELVIGASRDPQFGPAVMVGIGGVNVEVYRDVSFRVAPFDLEEALCAISELQGERFLTGFRGAEPVDRESLARAMVAVGNMMVICPDIAEIDLNPVMGNSRGVCAADVRVVVGVEG
jgi:acetyl-CoA synthetase (ADP-forming)